MFDIFVSLPKPYPWHAEVSPMGCPDMSLHACRASPRHLPRQAAERCPAAKPTVSARQVTLTARHGKPHGKKHMSRHTTAVFTAYYGNTHDSTHDNTHRKLRCKPVAHDHGEATVKKGIGSVG